jgi:RNA polymerase sigma-70 factor (ECF subfamily)
MMRYAGGDLGAFEQLYGRHKGRLFGYLLRACANRDVAGELFQDVWAKVVAARDRYVPSGSFGGWLYRLAHNRLMDHFRTVPKMVDTLEDVPEPLAPAHEQPERQAQSTQQRRRILKALAQLPEEQRTAFLLQQEGELSLEDIAAVTEVGRETVKSRLRYALAKLRQELADV